MAVTVAEVVLKLKQDASGPADKAAHSFDDVGEAGVRAQKALDGAGAAAGRLGTAATRATVSAGHTADTLGKLEHVAGRGGRAAMQLAGGLDLLVPGAGSAARAVGDFADIAEVAAMSGASFGLSLSSVVPILAVAAAALLTYKVVMDQVTDSYDRLHRQQEASTAATKSFASLADEVAASERAAELAAMPDDLRRVAEAEDKWNAKLAETKRLLAEQARLTPPGPVVGPERDGFAAMIAPVTGPQGEIVAAMLEAEALAERGKAADIAAAKAKDALAASARGAAKAITEEALAFVPLDSINAEIAAEAELARIKRQATLDLMDPQQRQLALIQEQIDAVRKLAATYPDLAEAAQAAIGKLNEQAIAVDLAGSGGPPVAVGASAADLAAGALSTVASGASGLAGAASMAGPYGAAIAAAINLVMGDGINELSAGIVKLGDRLGEVGGEVANGITRFGREGLPNLVEGLFGLVGDLITKVLPAWLELIWSPVTWGKLVESIALGIAGLLGDLFRGILPIFTGDFWKNIGAWIWDGLTGKKDPNDPEKGSGPLRLFGAEGGFADFAQNIAKAFTGEDKYGTPTGTTPSAGRAAVATLKASSRSGAASRSRQGGDVHVHVSGFAVGSTSQLVDEINRAVGSGRQRIQFAPGAVAT